MSVAFKTEDPEPKTEMPIRHVTRGLIDGSLSMLGVSLGAAISGDPRIVMAAGLGGAIANSISNITGAVTAERADVMKKLAKYERAMVGSEIDLKKTKIYEKEKKRILKGGLIDGAATFAGSIVPIAPYFLFGIDNGVIVSVGLTLTLLFVLGVYIGKLSKENIIIAGTKMALFGVVTAILASSLEFVLK